jgi:putative transposase
MYIDSEGNSSGYPGYYRKSEERLKKAQRKLSAQKKGGQNWDKQRNKVARLHEIVVNQRKDFLHKTSRQIANAYDGVAVENLNMRAIAQCLNLAKSTNDNGFGRLRSMLAYKLQEQGKQMVIIDKWYPSSKRCHKCGNDYKALTLGERSWTCECCNTLHDRDINAAINIKNEGCRILGIL